MITIYWGISPQTAPEGLRVAPPVPIMNNFLKTRMTKEKEEEGMNYNRCPAFTNELSNIYGMKSPYDYYITIDGDQVSTSFSKKTIGQPPRGDIDFFNQHVSVRSRLGNLFSFQQGFVFFTERPSLMMSQLPAFMEDNTTVKNTICIPGQFDIGKYFRTLDFACHFRDGCKTIEFNRKEITFYLKFHTKEKIKFKRFLFTEELSKLNGIMGQVKNRKEPERVITKALDFYYNIFDKYNFKNKMLKIIKENLCKEEDLEGNVI
jgi:hypothetical protein